MKLIYKQINFYLKVNFNRIKFQKILIMLFESLKRLNILQILYKQMMKINRFCNIVEFLLDYPSLDNFSLFSLIMRIKNGLGYEKIIMNNMHCNFA